MIGGAVLLLVVGVIIGLVLSSSSSADPVGGTDGAPATSAPVSPAAEPTTSTAAAPAPAPTSAAQPYSALDPPGQEGAGAKIVRNSDGKACRNDREASAYGGYPTAGCTLWKPATGLLSGERADKGNQNVACQRDLGRNNPVFAKGQANTWWVWTRSDSGTWDWFPETAVAEGASDQPINGIARCVK